MAGFGLRALRKVRDEDSQELTKQYISHLVCGNDFYAALTYLNLCEKYGEDKVLLVSETAITQDSIIGSWKCSLSTIRSSICAEYIKSQKPQLEITPFNGSNVFYKDTKFHKFGGRAKPHELKEDEAFYLEPFYQLNLQNLFTEDQWSTLNEVLAAKSLEKYIGKIEITEPKDLLEVTNFRVQIGENEVVNCEKLYWCQSPKSFFKKVENKNSLSDELAAYCSTLEHRIGLTVHFEIDKKVYQGKGTVFLPQSVTHEWGHFIADFQDYNEVTQMQDFTCMMFVDEDEVNEEDLAKKIKLMKRVIERVFPEFGKGKYKERIQYDREILVNLAQDELFPNYKKENIKFIGEGAPIDMENSEQFMYLSRGIASVIQF